MLALYTDLTASDSEGTLSADSEDGYDSDATIPYEYDTTFRFTAADGRGDRESASSDNDFTDCDEELETHKYVADRPLAPLSTSFDEQDDLLPEETLTPVSHVETKGITARFFDATAHFYNSVCPSVGRSCFTSARYF